MPDAGMGDFGRLHVVKITGTYAPTKGVERERTGTGFVIEKGVVATALHVVADRRHDPPELLDKLTLTFARRGEGNKIVPVTVNTGIRLSKYDMDQDWALLSFATDDEFPDIELQSRVSVGERFHSHGFAHPEGKSMSGEVVGYTVRKEFLWMQVRVDELEAQTPGPVRGYSGAPVIVAERAVGILTLRDGGPEGKDHPELAVGATLFAIPVRWLRDEQDRSVCRDLLIDHDDKAAIKSRVLPLLQASPELTNAVLKECKPGFDRRLGPPALAEQASEALCDTRALDPLLCMAESAVAEGVEQGKVWALFWRALRGCSEYVEAVERFRQDLITRGVAVLKFPVTTWANAELAVATALSRPPVIEFDKNRELVGPSLVRASDFRPDALMPSRAAAGDTLFASVVCSLASRYQARTMHPDDVYAFLARERNATAGDDRVSEREAGDRQASKVEATLRSINRAIEHRRRSKSARNPPYYVAVARADPADEQQAGLLTIKQHLPGLDVGVLGPEMQEIELVIIDVLKTLIE